MKNLSFIAALLFLNVFAHAQLLPPQQPEQDACNALQLCGNTFFTPYSYQGVGKITDLFSTPCGSPEANSVWLKVVVSVAGTIVFTITPVTLTDDYDFAVVNITGGDCNSIKQPQVVRCNFNNNSPVFNNGVVGLNNTSTVNTVASGTTGSSFVQKITAAVGDTYLVMVNNFGTGNRPSSGFTIDFTGSTAKFVDNTPPHFDKLTATSPCSNKSNIMLHLNTPIACSSIAADGSDFFLTPAANITSASGVNCSGSNGYTQDVLVSFATELISGAYALHAKVGTDHNTLLNLCNTALTVPDSLNFIVPPTPEYTAANLTCTTLTVQTSIPIKCSSIATDGSDFKISGVAPLSIAGAAGTGCTPAGYTNTITVTLRHPVSASGTYTLIAQYGLDGNSLLDSCNSSQAKDNSITFAAKALPLTQLADSLITCVNTGITLPLIITNTDPSLNYIYLWAPETGLSDKAVAQPLANPTGDVTYIVTINTNNTTTCATQDSVFVHSIQGFELGNKDTAVCEGASIPISVNGSDEYTYKWAPPTGVSNPDLKEPIITPTATEHYTLTASYPGCRDSVMALKIDVQPNPTGLELHASSTAMCQYDTILLNAIANPPGFNFTYKWSPEENLQYSSGANNVFFGDSTTRITVTVSSSIGCTGNESVLLTVYPGNFSSISENSLGLCPPDSVPLLAEGGLTYTWQPSYGLSDSAIANPFARPHTTTEYLMIARDVHGCRDSQLVKVAVFPSATITLPDSVAIYPGESYAITPLTNCLNFEWFPPSGLSATQISNPMASPEVRTRYYVNASTENGCAVFDSIDVLVMETLMDMPNAFAPGGNNKIFKPYKRGIAQLNSFRIYNRWGQKVFETTDINQGWDGNFHEKPQPLGVYLYTIDAVTDAGRPFVKNGNVTLIR